MDEALAVVIDGVRLVGDILAAGETLSLIEEVQEPLMLLKDRNVREVGHLAGMVLRSCAALAKDDGTVDDRLESVAGDSDHLVDAVPEHLLAQRPVRLDGHERVADDVGEHAAFSEWTGSPRIAEEAGDEGAVGVFGAKAERDANTVFNIYAIRGIADDDVEGSRIAGRAFADESPR